MLKSKPRILVTHQLQYLKTADKILILKEVWGYIKFKFLVATSLKSKATHLLATAAVCLLACLLVDN